jgi:chromosome partitioning protein
MLTTAAITPTDIANLLGGVSLQAVYKQMRTQGIDSLAASNRRRFIAPRGVRQILETKGFTFPKQNISFQIVKGGVGKTSLSYALATRASHYGARVLAIDFDQQGNLTRSFNVDARDRPVWLHVFRDGVPTKEAVVKLADNLDLLPSNLNNSRLDVELTGLASNLRDLVVDKIAPIRGNYDLVVMDCPPAINKINTAVACGSDLVVIPIIPDPYAIDGLEFTLAELTRIQNEFKVGFDYRILWNRYDARERLGVVYMHDLAGMVDLAQRLLPLVIRVDTSLKNAVHEAKSIFDMPKRSVIQEDIDQFTREILGINQWKEERGGQAIV